MNVVETLKPEPYPLKSLFDECRIKQVEVAHFVGLSPGRINLILHGYVKPTPKVEKRLLRLADIAQQRNIRR